MNKLLITLGFVFLFSASMFAQQPKCPVMPAGFLCITQEAGNQAKQDKIDNSLLKEKIAVLEAGMLEKDKSIAQIQKTADENTKKLEGTIHDGDVKLAEKTGQLIKCEAFAVRDAALIEYLVKNQRSKQQGLFNVKIGGN